MDTFLPNETAQCHAPNSDLIAAVQLKNHIKAQAATMEEGFSTILYSSLRTYPIPAANAILKAQALMLTI